MTFVSGQTLSLLASCLCSAAHLPDENTPGLRTTRLYYGAGQNIPLVAVAPPDVDRIDLVLMRGDGVILAAPRSAPVGPFNLTEVMPAAVEITAEEAQCLYLQMLVGNEPVGSALVLQPLLTPMIPTTEIAPHPVSGRPHTKIIGWALPELDTGARVFSGLRIHPERDVLLRTSLGEMVIALTPEQAPNTAFNFRDLADSGFYVGVIFHRVVPLTREGHPFVIQAGDPSQTGEGGPGFWLAMEPSDLAHDYGVISMARADDPNSAGGQFFICLSREGTARLDGQYCGFGYAVAGAETIQAIAAVELADVAAGRPVSPPVILAAELLVSPPRRPGHGRPDQRVSRPAPQVEARPERVPR